MTDYRPYGHGSSVNDDAIDLATLSGGGLHRHTYNREVSYTSLAPTEDLAYTGAGPFTSTERLRSLGEQGHQSPDPAIIVHQTPFITHLYLNWRLELIACILFVATFAALCGTLFAYASKPSPDWPTWLSLNTIVAIYVALLKAGLLLVAAEGLGQLKWLWIAGNKPRPLADLVKYDDASRGPFGALSLLWRLRASHVLSSLGALIIILGLAVDPFAQQIVHYYDCSIPVLNATAPSIPRTNFYAEVGGFHIGAGLQQMTPAVQGAVNGGLFNPSVSPFVNCATGNCSWSRNYSTLAWCSGCTDISSQLTITNHTFSGPNNFTYYNLTTTLPSTGLNINATMAGPLSQYAVMGLPRFIGPGAPLRDTSLPPSAIAQDFILGQKPGGAWNPSTGGPFPYCNTTVANTTLWPCIGHGASRCWLSPCVKTYSASVRAGHLNETLLDSSLDFGLNYTNLQLGMVDTECIDPSEKAALQGLGYVISGRWLAYNMTFYLSHSTPLNNTFPQSMALKNCVYGVDVIFMNSFAQYLSSFFSGVLTGFVPGPEIPIGTFYGPQPLQTIFNFGDVSFARMEGTYENVSLSLTNYVRQNGDVNNSSPVLGVADQDKTCISVQWAWLAFPGVLVLMTLGFFLALVAETRPSVGGGPQIWKSSLLPLLYHGPTGRELPEPRFEDERGVRERGFGLGGMMRRADGTRVRLDASVPDKIRLEVQ